VAAAVLGVAAARTPMVWDEGDAITRSEGIRRWVERFFGAAGGRPLSREAIRADWQFTTQREGHPAGYGIVIATGRWIAGPWLAPLLAARFGPVLLFSVAAGAFFYRMARQWSLAAAASGVAALLLLPRLFAHAQFATCDGPLTACWILAWATFAAAHRRWRWVPLWGAAMGLTFSCKATGWFVLVPFVVWALWYGDRRALAILPAGLAVALVTFFALNPPLWHDPLWGWSTFFQLNAGRAGRPDLNISTWFLGRMYNLESPLPWYNTLFWTCVTVPVGMLVLAGMGLRRAWRARGSVRRPAMLVVGHWLTLLVIRALPFAPPHDGVRLFLPSFALLAVIIGLGADGLLGRVRCSGWPGRLGAAGLLTAAYAGSATSLFWYAPQWLSYYNLVIGGLPGATAMGMEPTYYWDGLDGPVLQWIHRHTPVGHKVLFGPVIEGTIQAGPMENLRWMRRWGLFRRRCDPAAPGPWRWYVLQRRPSGMWPVDHWLVANAEPAFVKRIRPGGSGPWRLDVPLVEIYRYEDFLRARQAVDRGAAPARVGLPEGAHSRQGGRMAR